MKTIKIIFFSLISIFLISEVGLNQTIQLGVLGGYVRIQKPEIYSEKISNYGLGLNDAIQYGGKIKIGFKRAQLKITGLVRYIKLTDQKYSDVVNTHWS